MRKWLSTPPWVALSVGLGVALAGRADADPVPEFRAFLVPPSSNIEVGEAIDVRFEVDASARHFNAYAVTIAYDPAVVDFEGPVVQGALMTGACGQTIFFLTTTDSSLTYSHSLLCSGQALDGPGVLSSYRFRALAAGTSPLAIRSNPDCTFVDAGVCINPNHATFPRQVILTGGEIQVGPLVGVSEAGAPVATTVLFPSAPNPTPEATRLRFRLAAPGSAELSILDLQGRARWQRSWTSLAAGVHEVPWGGCDAAGIPLASGIYFTRLTTARGVAGIQKLTLAR